MRHLGAGFSRTRGRGDARALVEIPWGSQGSLHRPQDGLCLAGCASGLTKALIVTEAENIQLPQEAHAALNHRFFGDSNAITAMQYENFKD
jgi:hypothetical protein